MKVIELDGRQLTRTDKGHAYLKDMLEFPDYYGNNLDALYDLLTEFTEAVELHIINSEEMDKSIKRVFLDASNENNNLNIILTK